MIPDLAEDTPISNYFPAIEDILKANIRLKEVIEPTPLMANVNLSEDYGATVLLKREDLQVVRSYKIRGAYNKIVSLSTEEQRAGIVCASAGNHAQGVAFSCRKLGIQGKIFMPVTTPQQKIRQVTVFGKGMVEIVLTGDTYDDTCATARADALANHRVVIPPFDDEKIIEGQATVALEILEQTQKPIDYLFVPIGGGGLISGIGSYFKKLSPKTRIIGVEPEGAAAMKLSVEQGKIITLEKINKFVDGAAVQRVGDLNFSIARQIASEFVAVPEGKVCSVILKLYNEDAIVVEPAGALSVAVLDQFRKQIRGKTVVCIISGSNNDITRTEEIKERSMLYEGLKHYFLVSFPQRAGALKEFVVDVLGPDDDITLFEYSKKNSREKGPALIGLVVKQKEDVNGIMQRMDEKRFHYQYLNDQSDLFQYLI
ncbi:threonine ammonia-lyase [bacterium]|nr:threonine ammonia-lyase [bacterium]